MRDVGPTFQNLPNEYGKSHAIKDLAGVVNCRTLKSLVYGRGGRAVNCRVRQHWILLTLLALAEQRGTKLLVLPSPPHSPTPHPAGSKRNAGSLTWPWPSEIHFRYLTSRSDGNKYLFKDIWGLKGKLRGHAFPHKVLSSIPSNNKRSYGWDNVWYQQ